MNNNDQAHIDLHVRALVNSGIIKTGSIPKDAYSFLDPRMPVFTSKPDWEIEVDFD